MGLTDIKMTVSNPADPSRLQELTFLIDSGAIFPVVPRETLAELGILPQRTESFSLADCTHIEREVGTAMFTYKGKTSAAPVIFGEPGDAILLGVVALESLGLVFDPLRRELRPAVLRL
jgi:clan AA aspartic protease